MIGIALLIFGCEIYELVISGLDPCLEGGTEQHTKILSVNSLEILNNNLSNVIVVGLIVAAFMTTISFEVNNSTDLLALFGCVHVGPQRLVDCSQPWNGAQHVEQASHVRLNSRPRSRLRRDTRFIDFDTARAAVDRPH